MRMIVVEAGHGYRLVHCRKCGWREQVLTDAGAALVGANHLLMVHDEKDRASAFRLRTGRLR